jgi:hydrogenase nickel incorporation protein HypA/HybF
MHEASIVDSLIGLVRQNLPDGRRVRRVDVRVGLLTGVSPEAMQFYFEILREDTLGPQAELVVSLEPLQAHCESCGSDHCLTEVAWLCPACGAPALAPRNGDELHLSSFEVEDGEGNHD